MLGLGINISKRPVLSGPVYEAEFQAVLDRGTTLGYSLPTDPALTAGNTMVAALKTAGLWTTFDLFYVFATNGDSDFATLNWVNPAAFQCTKVNTPTFTSLEGFTGNAVDMHLDTNWTPSTNAVNFTLNSASVGLYTRNRGTAGRLAGSISTTPTAAYIDIFASTYNARINGSNTTTVNVDPDVNGFFLLDRHTSTDFRSFLNDGTSTLSKVAATTVLSPEKMLILISTLNGGTTGPSDAQMSIFFTSSSNGANVATLFTIIEAYMDALGKGVVA